MGVLKLVVFFEVPFCTFRFFLGFKSDPYMKDAA